MGGMDRQARGKGPSLWARARHAGRITKVNSMMGKMASDVILGKMEGQEELGEEKTLNDISSIVCMSKPPAARKKSAKGPDGSEKAKRWKEWATR